MRRAVYIGVFPYLMVQSVSPSSIFHGMKTSFRCVGSVACAVSENTAGKLGHAQMVVSEASKSPEKDISQSGAQSKTIALEAPPVAGLKSPPPTTWSGEEKSSSSNEVSSGGLSSGPFSSSSASRSSSSGSRSFSTSTSRITRKSSRVVRSTYSSVRHSIAPKDGPLSEKSSKSHISGHSSSYDDSDGDDSMTLGNVQSRRIVPAYSNSMGGIGTGSKSPPLSFPNKGFREESARSEASSSGTEKSKGDVSRATRAKTLEQLTKEISKSESKREIKGRYRQADEEGGLEDTGRSRSRLPHSGRFNTFFGDESDDGREKSSISKSLTSSSSKKGSGKAKTLDQISKEISKSESRRHSSSRSSSHSASMPSASSKSTSSRTSKLSAEIQEIKSALEAQRQATAEKDAAACVGVDCNVEVSPKKKSSTALKTVAATVGGIVAGALITAGTHYAHNRRNQGHEHDEATPAPAPSSAASYCASPDGSYYTDCNPSSPYYGYTYPSAS